MTGIHLEQEKQGDLHGNLTNRHTLRPQQGRARRFLGLTADASICALLMIRTAVAEFPTTKKENPAGEQERAGTGMDRSRESYRNGG